MRVAGDGATQSEFKDFQYDDEDWDEDEDEDEEEAGQEEQKKDEDEDDEDEDDEDDDNPGVGHQSVLIHHDQGNVLGGEDTTASDEFDTHSQHLPKLPQYHVDVDS